MTPDQATNGVCPHYRAEAMITQRKAPMYGNYVAQRARVCVMWEEHSVYSYVTKRTVPGANSHNIVPTNTAEQHPTTPCNHHKT